MIKLKNILFEDMGDWDGEGPAWNGKTFELISDFYIPLSPPAIKRHLGSPRIKSFHVTNIAGVKKLKTLNGKSKQISTFIGVGSRVPVVRGGGVQTEGGIIVQVEGNLVFHGFRDMNTRPDESGRRWVDPDTFFDMFSMVNEIDEDFFRSELRKRSKTWRETEGVVTDKKVKAQLISDYMDMIEGLIWKRNAKNMKRWFGKDLADLSSAGPSGSVPENWNELSINKIKLNDAIITGAKDWSDDTWDDAKKATEKAVSGKVVLSKDGSDIEKWITSRGGKIK